MSHHLLIQFITWFVLCYFVLLNGGYLVLNMMSLRSLHRKGQEEMIDDLPRVSGVPVIATLPAGAGALSREEFVAASPGWFTR